MGELKHIIKLNDEQLETLMTAGSITVGETTIELDLCGLYLTADEDKYVLYSSTGTVTVATPSVGTDAVNLDYFNANLPMEKKLYRHEITIVVNDDTLMTTIIDSNSAAKQFSDLEAGKYYHGYLERNGDKGTQVLSCKFTNEGIIDTSVVNWYDGTGYVGVNVITSFNDTVTEL